MSKRFLSIAIIQGFIPGMPVPKKKFSDLFLDTKVSQLSVHESNEDMTVWYGKDDVDGPRPKSLSTSFSSNYQIMVQLKEGSFMHVFEELDGEKELIHINTLIIAVKGGAVERVETWEEGKCTEYHSKHIVYYPEH